MKNEMKLRNLEVKDGMRLRDKDFHGSIGITKSSIWFWEQVKDKVGEVIEAEAKFDEKHWHRLVLYTTKGVKVVLYGCSAGFRGEGSRGTATILKDCGFDPRRVEEVVFSQKTFTIYRLPRIK